MIVEEGGNNFDVTDDCDYSCEGGMLARPGSGAKVMSYYAVSLHTNQPMI